MVSVTKWEIHFKNPLKMFYLLSWYSVNSASQWKRLSEFRDLSEKALNFVQTAITIAMRVERLYEHTPQFYLVFYQ